MNTRHQRTLKIGILAFFLSSSVVFADNAEEMARADDFYNKQEISNASKAYTKLAFQNYLPAQVRLADLMYASGYLEVSTGWCIMAAFQGDVAGANCLANAYIAGYGINKDPEQALYWYKIAANGDVLNAVRVLAASYLLGSASGLPLPVDLKQAEYWKARDVILTEENTKRSVEERAALQKKLDEKAAAIKEADKEAASKSKQGQAK